MGEMNHMYSNLFFPMQLRKSKYWLQGMPLSFQNTKICASLSTIQEISSFPHWFSSKNPPHCSQTPHSWPQLTPVHTTLSQHATWPHLDLKVEVEDRFCVGKSIKWVMRISWKKLGTSIFPSSKTGSSHQCTWPRWLLLLHILISRLFFTSLVVDW